MGTVNYSITISFNDTQANVATFSFNSGNDAVTTSEPGTYQRQTFPTSTSSTALPTALIGTLGLVALRNCDATNAINVYANTSDTHALLTINPGEVHFTRFATGSTPTVAATTGAPLLEYLLFGN